MNSPPGDARVAFALARGEARRIVRSVAFLVFLLLTLLSMRAAAQARNTWDLTSIDAALGLVPLGWCLLVLTDLATLRDKRRGVDGITDTLPASVTARTGGHLLGGLVGVPVAAVLLGMFALIQPRIGTPNLAELAVGVLLVAGGAVVGVAVARWLPHPLFTVPAIIVTVVLTGKIGEAKVSRTRFLGFVTNSTPTGLADLEIRPSAYHLVWLLAWIGIMAVVALLRSDRRPATFAVGIVLVAVAAASGFGQVRAIDAETAADRADFLNQPTLHQTCESVDGVDYCAFASADHYVDEWQQTVAAIRVHLNPTVQARPLVVSQRVPWHSGNSNCGQDLTLKQMDAPISARVSPAEAWSADGQVHPGIHREQLGCGGDLVNTLFTGVQVGAWAVGLPPAQSGEGEVCAADGQARSVIALWLGTRGGGRLDAYRGSIVIGPDGRADMGEWDNPPTWGVAWHPSDLDVALAMTKLPVPKIDAVLSDHWDELVDPETPTSRAVELLDLPPAAPIREPLDTCAPT